MAPFEPSEKYCKARGKVLNELKVTIKMAKEPLFPIGFYRIPHFRFLDLKRAWDAFHDVENEELNDQHVRDIVRDELAKQPKKK